MICGQCGEPLTKIPIVKSTQIFALITVLAFVSPLMLMLFSFNMDTKKPKPGIDEKSNGDLIAITRC